MRIKKEAAWIVLGVLVAMPALGEPVDYDIPAGDASKTLGIYLQQTRIEMLYVATAVRGRKTRPVHGTLEPRVALALMLEGTDLGFRFTPDFTFASVAVRTGEDEERNPASPDSSVRTIRETEVRARR